MSESTPARHPRVLVVDDEEAIRRALRSILRVRDYDVMLAATGAEALDAAVDARPDLVILDLSLPDMSGLEVCRELRAWLDAPILVLSVHDSEADKVAALDMGADDYLTKPFSAGELLARLRALMRRSQGGAASPPVIEVSDLTVDLARRRVSVGGQEVRLTRTEFDILALLARSAGCVVTAKSILEEVWGSEYAGDLQTLRVHVSHLRQKVERDRAVPRRILTEPGVGFRLSTDA